MTTKDERMVTDPVATLRAVESELLDLMRTIRRTYWDTIDDAKDDICSNLESILELVQYALEKPMPMCVATIQPFLRHSMVMCEKPAGHDGSHKGTLLDSRYPRSDRTISWDDTGDQP